jgi:transposase
VDYQRYSSQFKAAILTKLSQSDLSVRKLAGQEYSWQKQLNTSGLHMTKASSSDKWSSEEKFAVVLETATLSAVELSEYYQIKGLYSEQVKAWKQACIAVNTTTKLTKRAKITRELRRKDKALTETAAWLVLGKKFDAY